MDRSVEQSIHALFDAALVPDKTSHYLAQNYYACVQAAGGGCIASGTTIPEVPSVLKEPFTASAFAAAGLSSSLLPTDASGNKSYYVIERMCLNPGVPVGSNCNLSAVPSAPIRERNTQALSVPATPLPRHGPRGGP